MKRRMETVLDEDVLRRAKCRAAEESRPLNDVIQDALERYLSEGAPQPTRRDAAYQCFCERPMRLAPEQLKTVLDQHSWDL